MRGPFPLSTAGLVLGTSGTSGSMVTTADRSLWFAMASSPAGPAIGRIDAAGKVTSVPTHPRSGPSALTAGRDGTVWFTDPGETGIGFVTSSGAAGRYPIGSKGFPRLATTIGVPAVTVGPDKAIWFTRNSLTAGAAVGRIDTGRTPRITAVYDLPDGANLRAIVTGSDGNLWVTQQGRMSVARVTPRGQVTEYTLGDDRYPETMAADQDGRIWFTFLSPRRAGGVDRFDTPR